MLRYFDMIKAGWGRSLVGLLVLGSCRSVLRERAPGFLFRAASHSLSIQNNKNIMFLIILFQCLACSPVNLFMYACACLLAVCVAVWDLTSGATSPIASRQLVLSVNALEAAARGIVSVAWESDKRFVCVGSAGMLEFELQLPRDSSPATLRYRIVLKPEELIDSV